MKMSKYTFWRFIAIFSGIFISACFAVAVLGIRAEDRLVYLYALVPVFIFLVYSEIHQMIYPLDLRIYIYWIFLFANFSLAYGSSAFSIILFFCCFFLGHKIRFFNSHRKIKFTLGGIVIFAAFCCQFRLEKQQLISSVIELVFSGTAVILMLLITRKLMKKINQEVLEVVEPENLEDYFSGNQFTERDKVMLKEVLEGCKYEEIAINHELSLSSVKKRLAFLYKKLGVTCQIDFIIKFSQNSTKV